MENLENDFIMDIISLNDDKITTNHSHFREVWLSKYSGGAELPRRTDFTLMDIKSDAPQMRVTERSSAGRINFNLMGSEVTNYIYSEAAYLKPYEYLSEDVLESVSRNTKYVNDHRCGLLITFFLLFPNSKTSVIETFTLPILGARKENLYTIGHIHQLEKGWDLDAPAPDRGEFYKSSEIYKVIL